MAYQIVTKIRFKKNVTKVPEFLESEWSYKVAEEFLNKIDKKLNILSIHPMIGKFSQKYKNVRGVLITRHNKMYCRIEGNKIIIINLFDTISGKIFHERI